MATISIPVESGNSAVSNGSIGKVMQEAAERWKPEAMYFTAIGGKRTAVMVFEMAESSSLPPFAEPFFQQLNAHVEIGPAMTAEDLQKGLSSL